MTALLLAVFAFGIWDGVRAGNEQEPLEVWPETFEPVAGSNRLVHVVSLPRPEELSGYFVETTQRGGHTTRESFRLLPLNPRTAPRRMFLEFKPLHDAAVAEWLKTEGPLVALAGPIPEKLAQALSLPSETTTRVLFGTRAPDPAPSLWAAALAALLLVGMHVRSWRQPRPTRTTDLLRVTLWWQLLLGTLWLGYTLWSRAHRDPMFDSLGAVVWTACFSGPLFYSALLGANGFCADSSGFIIQAGFSGRWFEVPWKTLETFTLKKSWVTRTALRVSWKEHGSPRQTYLLFGEASDAAARSFRAWGGEKGVVQVAP